MRSKNPFYEVVLFALGLAAVCVVSAEPANSSAQAGGAASQASAPAQSATPAQAAPPAWQGSQVHHLSHRAEMYYQGAWGVDSLKVSYTESGEMIRFTYRVVDPNKAAALNDKKAEPSLIDLQAGVRLTVPQMEKVGKLRQSSTPIVGKSYWMAFANGGRRVRPGHSVIVEIGHFRADGLIVE